MALSIELTDPELKLLQQLLHGDKARLGFEIAHTDHRALRDELKKREELLAEVIAKLERRTA